MLVCPTCGGHFEARIAPWKGHATSTSARPGGGSRASAATRSRSRSRTRMTRCLMLSRGRRSARRFIDDLLRLVDTTPDPTAHLQAERDRLAGEIENLVKSVAKGMPAETIAPVVREYQQRSPGSTSSCARRARRRRTSHAPRGVGAAAEAWKAELRAEPKVARMLLRRLVGPISVGCHRRERRGSSGRRA